MLCNLKTISQLKKILQIHRVYLQLFGSLCDQYHNPPQKMGKNEKKLRKKKKKNPIALKTSISTRLDLTESLYLNIMNTHIEGVHRAYIMRFVYLHP